MDENLFKLIKEACEVPGPVGHERLMQDFLANRWLKSGFKISKDKIGNLFGIIEGQGPKIAIVSHADTIGFMVQNILPNGFVKVGPNTISRSPDTRFLPGTSLMFITDDGEKIRGYFGLKSGHLIDSDDKKENVPFNQMFVDIGVNGAMDVENLGIHVGTPAIFGNEVELFQENIVGPSMDNRVACTIQCEIARWIHDSSIQPNLTLISTVQEEIGMKGAAAAASKFSDFDAVIVLDVGIVSDIPNVNDDSLNTKLGKGPIIVYKDFAIHYSIDLIRQLESVAASNDINYQRAIFKNYMTDGMYFFQNGYPTTLITIPCRYTHTHFETVRLVDVQSTIRLIQEFLGSDRLP
ncbi:MAG: M42 family metallopeptidase [Promethearchaeota archaeon]